jgi:hypothetical protein
MNVHRTIGHIGRATEDIYSYALTDMRVRMHTRNGHRLDKFDPVTGDMILAPVPGRKSRR